MQLEHVLELRRLAGAGLDRLSCSYCFVPFLHSLPNLQSLDLVTCQVSNHCQDLLLDLGPLYALKNLHVLHLWSGNSNIGFLERLTSLQELHMVDWKRVSPSQLSSESAFCRLPTSLTKLCMDNLTWQTDATTALVRPALQQFTGHLASLKLGSQFMKQFGNNAAVLSSLQCLWRLRELRLAISGTPTVQGFQLSFPCLQTLEFEVREWAADRQPKWDLSRCPALHMLILTFWDNGSKHQAAGPVDLRGITVNQGLLLHLALWVPTDKQAFADFAGWNLETVTMRSAHSDWRQVQSMLDLLGRLIDHVPISDISIDGEPVQLVSGSSWLLDIFDKIVACMGYVHACMLNTIAWLDG